MRLFKPIQQYVGQSQHFWLGSVCSWYTDCRFGSSFWGRFQASVGGSGCITVAKRLRDCSFRNLDAPAAFAGLNGDDPTFEFVEGCASDELPSREELEPPGLDGGLPNVMVGLSDALNRCIARTTFPTILKRLFGSGRSFRLPVNPAPSASGGVSLDSVKLLSSSGVASTLGMIGLRDRMDRMDDMGETCCGCGCCCCCQGRQFPICAQFLKRRGELRLRYDGRRNVAE